MRDYKRIYASNDPGLIADGLESRRENKKDLDDKVSLLRLGKEMRDLANRPRNKFVGILMRYCKWL